MFEEVHEGVVVAVASFQQLAIEEPGLHMYDSILEHGMHPVHCDHIRPTDV